MLKSLFLSKQISAAAYAFAKHIESQQEHPHALTGTIAALCFQSVSQGHSCLQHSQLIALFPSVFENMEKPVADFSELFAGNCMVENVLDNAASLAACALVINNERLYLQKYWQLETRLLQHLTSRLPTPYNTRTEDIAFDLSQLYQQHRLVFLTGGPGTGKTTTVGQSLVYWLQQQNFEHNCAMPIVLCAPTGKAAARMSEALNTQRDELIKQLPEHMHSKLPNHAVTLHRALGLSRLGVTTQLQPTQRQPKLFVVDESSMVDLPLMLQLFDSVSADTTIVLVGDPNQLPSVETGNILGSLIYSQSALFSNAHIELRTNFRQVDAPGISQLSADCLEHDAQSVWDALSNNQYAECIPFTNSKQDLDLIINEAVSFYSALSLCESAEKALLQLNQRIILCPTRNGYAGSETINSSIQQRMSSQARFHGQVILITENNAALGLANGDTGIFWQHHNELHAHFRIHGAYQSFSIYDLPSFELAYALTIHKAQGSEYLHVDLILPEQDNPLMNKALLYTAITRAKRSIRVFTAAIIFTTALRRTSLRMNGLSRLTTLNEK